MITGLQLAILSGGLIGLGVTLLVARLLPVEPDLVDALQRVSSTRARTTATAAAAQTSKERLGLWGLRVLPPGLWVRTPSRELALLRISVGRLPPATAGRSRRDGNSASGSAAIDFRVGHDDDLVAVAHHVRAERDQSPDFFHATIPRRAITSVPAMQPQRG